MQIQMQSQMQKQVAQIEEPPPQQPGQTLREKNYLLQEVMHQLDVGSAVDLPRVDRLAESFVLQLNRELEASETRFAPLALEVLATRCSALAAENETLATVVRRRGEKRREKRQAAAVTAAEAAMQCSSRSPPIPTNVIDALGNADFASLVSTCRAAASDSWACRRCKLPDVALGMGVGGSPTWRLLRTRAAGRGGASLVEKAVLHVLAARRIPWTRVQLASGRYVAAWVATRASAWKSLSRFRCRPRLRHHLASFLRGRLNSHV